MEDQWVQGLNILDYLTDGLLVQSVPTGGIVHVNRGFLNLLVCDRARLTCHPNGWIDHIYSEDRHQIRHWWQQLLNQPDQGEQTYRLLQPDGQFRWIQCRSFPLHPQPGNSCCLATLHVDVTAQHRQQPRPPQDLNELKRLFDPLLIGISCCGADGQILWANEAFHHLLDYTPKELLDRSLQELIAPSCQLVWAAIWEPPQPQPWSKELELLSGLNQSRWMLTTVTPLPPPPRQKAAFLCMIQDITRYKKNEVELRASLEDTEVLIAEIHHRVKNNLQIISSLLELQANRTQDANARTTLLSSQDRVLAMSLIHEILYQSDNIAQINFGTYVQQLVGGLTRAYLLERTIRFSLNLSSTATLSTNLAIPLGLILNELVTNAFKHGLAHSPQGTLAIDLQPLPDQRFKLSIGQTPGDLSADFTLEQTSSMGLQIVKLLTHKIGATLTIQRHPTIFTIIFPADL